MCVMPVDDNGKNIFFYLSLFLCCLFVVGGIDKGIN